MLCPMARERHVMHAKARSKSFVGAALFEAFHRVRPVRDGGTAESLSSLQADVLVSQPHFHHTTPCPAVAN
jgi:hypothetical protein